MVRIAMTDMMLHDDGHTNVRNTDALLSFENYPDILQIEKDDNTNPEVFDVILTNPPFGSLMSQEVMEMVGRFELGHKKKTLPMEYIGLERCFQFLRPGGKLAIVLPDGLLKNKNSAFVRRWIEEIAEIRAVISIPEEAFQSFGAMVKTSLCIFQKKERKVAINKQCKTMLSEIENIGYDATGRPKAGSEVEECAMAYHREIGWQ